MREQFEDPDADFEEFRTLLGAQGLKELNQSEQDDAHKRAFLFWLRHPLARRLISIYADFIVGNGVRVVADSDMIQERVITPFWELNALDERMHRLAGEFRQFGETVIEPVDMGGTLYLNFLDPFMIQSVDAMKISEGQFLMLPGVVRFRQFAVRLQGAARLPDRAVVIQAHEALRQFEAINTESGDPRVFYFRANTITGAMRGHSDLMPLLDYLDVVHNMAFTIAERQLMLTTLLMHARGDNLDKPKQDSILSTISNARPGTSIYTDKSVEINAVAPNLQNADQEAGFRVVKNMVLGGAGLPEGYFADGAQSNLATLQAQGLPTLRAFVALQQSWVAVIRQLVGEAIRRAIRVNPALASEPQGFAVNVDPVTQKEQAAAVAAFGQVVSAASTAEDLRYVTRDEAAALVRSVAAQISDSIEEAMPEELASPPAAPAVPPEPAARAEAIRALAAKMFNGS